LGLGVLESLMALGYLEVLVNRMDQLILRGLVVLEVLLGQEMIL
jgi:hypothetical protein